MKCRYIILASAIILLVTGCGTATTVFRGDEITSRDLNKSRTYCESIPRVYSGVSYDFCRLHGKPAAAVTASASYAMPAVVLDAILSVVLDTVILPYTVYRQINEGNIQIKSRKLFAPERP